MNQNDTLENRLEELGTVLRARPRLTGGVMDKVRESVADGSTEGRSTLAPHARMRARRQLFSAAAGTVAAITVGVFVATALIRSPTAGWADVMKAIQSQSWIRGTVTFPDGDRATMWLSVERQIWAFRSRNSFRFFDGRERAKYEYYGGSKPVTKTPLGEEDAQRVLPVDALSQDKDGLGPWLFGTEKIVEQKRREVMEGGKTWIEFEMLLWRGETNQATLRVDPETKLPIYLLLTSAKDATKSFKYLFDYPTDGPTDIYALGVPRDVKIDSHMQSDGAQDVLDAMATSRACIDRFRLMVAAEGSDRTFIVWRKGNRWRVDLCYGSNPPKPADGQAVSDWFAERLSRSPQVPLYVCDGKTVHTAVHRFDESGRLDGAEWQRSRNPTPQDLMSGEGLGHLPSAPNVKLASLVYPDLTPRRGWTFEFDPHPADARSCVLIKRSAHLATKEPRVGLEWYYIDPAKGHAVVRVELFNLPADTPANPEAASASQTIRMEDFQQSPDGFWYPSVVHDSTGPSTGIPFANRQGRAAIRHAESTVRYYFNFDVDLPDSFFTIDEARIPEE